MYRSTSKENAKVQQVLSGDKRDGLTQSQQLPVLSEHPESKELEEEMNRLMKIINEKQQLIVGIRKKLGDFVGGFRTVRAGLNDIKEETANEATINSMEEYIPLW